MLGKIPTEPRAPESVPKYVREGLDRQDRKTLRDVIMYCEQRIKYLNAEADRDPDEEELADEGEEIVEVEKDSEGTRVVKKVACGKDNCSTCPHRPYLYLIRREGDSLVWDYQSAVEAGVHINQVECLWSLLNPWLAKFRGLSKQDWSSPSEPTGSFGRSTLLEHRCTGFLTASSSTCFAKLGKSRNLFNHRSVAERHG
jgi:hypothetical protein